LGDANPEGNQFQGFGGNDFIDGRASFDRALYFRDTTLSGINVDMGAGTVIGDAAIGTDTLRSIEAVRGTRFVDTYDATTFGQAGALNIGSNGVINEFEGEGGNDIIIGNGSTRISYTHALAGVTVDIAAGTAQGTAAGDVASVGFDMFSGVNSLTGSTFDDALYGSNSAQFETFQGFDGNDVIDGRGGFDRAAYTNTVDGLATSAGISVNLAAGAVTGIDAAASLTFGSDTLRSIEGVRGSEGDDLFDATGYGFAGALNIGSNGTLNEFEGMAGDDTVIGNGNTRISYSLATAGVTVNLSTDSATGDASVGDDTIIGGVTRVRGSQFDDHITGNAANNNLEGQGGDDTLIGGGGNDILIGGAGADLFTYTATNEGVDQITDFSGHGGGGDLFRFDHLAFGNGLAELGADTGVLDAARFVADGTGPTTADQVFWFNTTDSRLYFDADGSGAGAAVAIVQLNNGFVPNNTDLILF
jgi:hypothetical protein